MEYLDTSRDLAAISFLPARVLRAASAIFRLPCSGNEGYHGSLAIRKPRTTCRSLGLPETAHDARPDLARSSLRSNPWTLPVGPISFRLPLEFVGFLLLSLCFYSDFLPLET